ncbi:hypothetical protein HWV62_17581 [Athelia sp. TMB]|nr:hypothetical protein HWV62_17581 [Athelia sp. TMB]
MSFNQFNEKAIDISRSLKLAMQSGAFIQLILTLFSICSRMAALMPELQDALQDSWTACHAVLKIVDHEISMSIELTKNDAVNSVTMGSEASDMQEMQSFEVTRDEDTGSLVPRPAATDEQQGVPTYMPESADNGPTSIPCANDEVVALTKAASPAAPSATIAEKPLKASATRLQGGLTITKKAKKKRKKDAIDEIFGF